MWGGDIVRFVTQRSRRLREVSVLEEAVNDTLS
jgi:hypothetical protein